jgi:hypothetical protein
MKRQSKKTKARAAEAHPIQDAFRADHPRCWWCLHMGYRQADKTEIHHIAGKAHPDCECCENYAALCRRHHAAIQSRQGAEAACLALKMRFDRGHYSPAMICRLRRKAESWITDSDVELAANVLAIARACR